MYGTGRGRRNEKDQEEIVIEAVGDSIMDTK